MRDAACDPVVVVVGAAGESVREHLAAAPVRIVDCPTWAQGMGESLRAGLAVLDDLAVNAAVVTLVDLPDVGSDVVVRLVAASSANGPSARSASAGPRREGSGASGLLTLARADPAPGPGWIGRSAVTLVSR